MSNQIVISSGAKVRELEGVLTGTSGVVNALGINVPSGIPQLDGSGKILVSQLPNSVMEYKGSWNAATNTPTLVNGTGNAGDVYLCEVAGTVNFGAGPITFAVGDQVIYSGAIWQRASGATGTVTSVAVTESGDALTITGSPITTSGTINIGFAGNSGQYVNGAGGLTTFPSLTGFVPYTGATGSVDLGLYSLFANDLFANGNGTNNANLYLKQGTSSLLIQNGYSNILATGTKIGFQVATSAIAAYYADFQFSSLTAQRTYNLPDLSGTLALLEGTQTFTGLKTFADSIQAGYGISLYNGIGTGALVSATYTGFYAAKSGTYTNITFAHDGDPFFSRLKLLNNATYDYTFPALSGTLALTSDLGAYVTLATTQTITAQKSFSNLLIGEKGIILGTGSTTFAAGSTTLNGNANGLTIGLGVTVSGTTTNYAHQLLFPQITPYTYTYPASSGTIALTSDIPSLTGYVPYTGATTNVNLGTFDLTADVITGATGSFASSGGSDTFAINHSSGSGIALNITKGGNGEGLVINKTSGSGNALSVTGSTSLGTLTGTSATFSSDILVSGVRVGTGSGGTNNTRVGALSFMSNTTGGYNTAIGSSSLNLNTTGSNNTAVGNGSLQQNTTGDANTAVGLNSLVNNTTGFNNTAIGYSVLGNSTTASNNVAIGYGSGVNISTGSNNTLITGGGSITTGSNNTIIGNYAGTTTLANNIVLADGQGNIRYQWNGTNNVFTGAATFSSSASSGQNLRLQTSIAAGRNYVQWANGSGDMGYIGYGGADGKFWINNQLADDMLFHNNGSERMRITSGGNVGIGTSSPNYPLHVYKSGSISTINVESSSGQNAQFRLEEAGSVKAAISWISSDSSTRIFSNGSDRITITSGGNVLIGTTTDSGFKLQVNGSARLPLISTENNLRIADTNVAYTLFTISAYGLYIVYVDLPAGSGSPSEYSAYAIISHDGTTARILQQTDASRMFITLSGNNVQGRQTSGGQYNIRHVYQRIGV